MMHSSASYCRGQGAGQGDHRQRSPGSRMRGLLKRRAETISRQETSEHQAVSGGTRRTVVDGQRQGRDGQEALATRTSKDPGTDTATF